MRAAIKISYKGLNYKERFALWWSFTRAVLFQTNERWIDRLKEPITIYHLASKGGKSKKK